MKILITGAGGQLGEQLVELLGQSREVRGLTHADLDVTNRARVHEVVKDFDPDAVVNAAAYTDVDGAESEPDEAFAVNATGVKHLVEAAREVEARLVHVSTDYVFGGDQNEPYTRRDCPEPINTYGTSKLAGEHFVLNYCRGTVVRTSGIYGGEPGKHANFVNTILELARKQDELKIVDDQVHSPTWSRSLARLIDEVLEEKLTGLQHYTSAGETTWYEFTEYLLDLAGIEKPVRPISSEDLDRAAARPSYSVLRNSREAKSWREMLRDYFDERAENL